MLRPLILVLVRLVELHGRSVFPGFIDTHMHSMDTLPPINGVKLSPYQTAEEVLGQIAEHARTHPHQSPLLGIWLWHLPSAFLGRRQPSSMQWSLTGLH